MQSKSQSELGLSQDELEKLLKSNEPLLLFDLRLKEEFEQGHIKGSVHAVCDAKAKETIMAKIPKKTNVVLISDPEEHSRDTAQMMTSFGIDARYLKGGFAAWKGEIAKGRTGNVIDADTLFEKLEKGDNVYLLDVRTRKEFSEYKIPGSVNIPLNELFQKDIFSEIPTDREIVTICSHGNRAMVASFALARQGISSTTLSEGLAGWNQVLKEVTITKDPINIIQIQKVGKGCLSYVAVSGGKAIVIDPLYPYKKYTELARKNSFKIIKVLDTHHHADHVSAARDLAKETGAELHLSKYENYEYDASFLKDNDNIEFGESKLKVIHTPGHTAGSLSFVIGDKYIFTGDILFVESIGRPDLRDKAEEFTKELYHTLHEKLLRFHDDSIILPAHKGDNVDSKDGSFYSSIKDSKNLPLVDLPKDEFVKRVVSATQPRPMNYEKIIKINGGTLDLAQSEIPDLEIGPNRCAVNAS